MFVSISTVIVIVVDVFIISIFVSLFLPEIHSFVMTHNIKPILNMMMPTTTITLITRITFHIKIHPIFRIKIITITATILINVSTIPYATIKIPIDHILNYLLLDAFVKEICEW